MALGCSLSLDLSVIKVTVFNLLPSTLGKNAIVEAELEVKTFTETESIDYDLYERMRKIEKDTFPVDEAISLLREKCFEYCTLADKEDQLYLQKSIQKRNNNNTIIISPIIAIYVTTIMEHIAEYLLTAVAMSAEHEETDYVRVKEVYLALVDDVQLGNVFGKMNLKEKMEKRVGLSNRVRGVSYLPTITNNNNNKRKSFHSTCTNINQEITLDEAGSMLAINIEEDFDLDYFDENIGKNNNESPPAPPQVRPHSSISLHTNSSRKSTFHVLKVNRNSFCQFDEPSRSSSPVTSIYDPDNVPTMNCDELVRSGGTVKVSLTPNRLRSIEIKDPTKEDSPPPPELTWERRSVSSSRLPTNALSRNTSKRSTTLNIDPRSKEKPNANISATPKSPSLLSPVVKKAGIAQSENPKDTPKLLKTEEIKKQITPLPAISSFSQSDSQYKSTTLTSSSSSDSISSSNSSVPSNFPAPVIPSPPSYEIKPSTMITVQDSNVAPKVSKSSTTEGIILRRSSVSSRKSRENLRRVKSIEGQQMQNTEAAPKLPEKPQQQEIEKEQEQEENTTDNSPQRPSTIVAKRASTVGNIRRRSLHESYATEKHLNQRGSVSVSIKQWDDILKSEQPTLVPPAAQRRSMLREIRQQQLKEMQQEKEGLGTSSNAVLDKVLKFERASSMEDVSQHRVSSLPRRERFLYLQQDPSAIERKSTVRTTTRPKSVDQSTQTEVIKKEEEQEGLVDGDEEWFLQDDEWDEQEETAIVDWLLGE
ncbi:hypothetical protein RO3G_08171 [Rhizopus delemar RA 99-880]|uniref:Uncharacterized protein n=1 Tax=Rhizopus delemar (strain RA 99-880 / ATCC MYA-4621 / FGSC 9543 / NRRL 43880) TaxID=246409 RepID=I1C4T6_RHIO9|nr:hypothetical protein RO3G_08171 [Rhizopus delemar RA 99-880]|eukprot:EIE83466.1 hypothetical protein RO3G_08171 [Rhizopus delemar RA 99-880]